MVFAKFICIAHLKNKAVQNALRKTSTCKDTIIALTPAVVSDGIAPIHLEREGHVTLLGF